MLEFMKKMAEIKFLKLHSYEEINDMFRELTKKYEGDVKKLTNALEIVRDNSLNPNHTMTVKGLEDVVDANYKIAVKALSEVK